MMTLEQFRAARRAVDDLSEALPPDLVENYPGTGPGIIYPGDLVIELSADSDDYTLTIGSVQQTAPLAALEESLYRWAVSEEITEIVS